MKTVRTACALLLCLSVAAAAAAQDGDGARMYNTAKQKLMSGEKRQRDRAQGAPRAIRRTRADVHAAQVLHPLPHPHLDGGWGCAAGKGHVEVDVAVGERAAVGRLVERQGNRPQGAPRAACRARADLGPGGRWNDANL